MNATESKDVAIIAEPMAVNGIDACRTGAPNVYESDISDVSSIVSDATGSALVVDSTILDAESFGLDSSGGSVSVRLQTAGLALQVRTQFPTGAQILDLSARLDVLTQLLDSAQHRLQTACTRIGFLEAQLQQRDELIEYLSGNQSTQIQRPL